MDDRQKKLLKEIVESYIKNARPVGSKSLCGKLKCSSATIRNEMAILEHLGMLEKNHISSGRIPSEEGYKYYVENLMKPKELTGEDVLKLQTIFHNNALEVSDAINECVKIISEITNYTSIVLGKSDNKIVALVCTDKGIVENKQFTLAPNIFIDEVVKTSEIINKMLVGTPIDEVSARLEFDIKPIIAKKVREYQAVYNIFYDAFNDFAKNSSNVFFSGKANMLKQPEYSDAAKIKNIINKFEDEDLIKNIEEDENGINVYIGQDNHFDDDVTVIKTKYNINGEEGTIAIVGPKRMEYDRVIALLDYINQNIGNR